ncbi:hypothetical protein K491DRAFT_759092 [Lophiostoma macrostomum CBS 122681]|uniref:Uncharacterized protein n=1 Tax=Lophiostoma macrostomum CBS 122681 TaxID=1314788 RepID=A0A6A6T3K2_9PLEO|nr:hypothetical protein K491DRAFT_759092 [Lophiostoma macrostomum CBS 122681]
MYGNNNCSHYSMCSRSWSCQLAVAALPKDNKTSVSRRSDSTSSLYSCLLLHSLSIASVGRVISPRNVHGRGHLKCELTYKASSSTDTMEKRDLAANSRSGASTHRRVRLLIDFGTGIAMWISSTTTSTIILALQAQPSTNIFLRRWQKLAAKPVEGVSGPVLFSCITLCSTVYVAACMQLYCTAPGSVAMISAACILLVFFEACLNGLEVTPVERLAVVLPSLINIGLSWTVVHRLRERSQSAPARTKLEIKLRKLDRRNDSCKVCINCHRASILRVPAAATMSRRAMLMTSGACVVEEGSQLVDEDCVVAPEDSTPCNQAPRPTPPPAQQTTAAPRPSPRDQKRKAYYYNNLEHRARLNNKANKPSQRSLRHNERVEPHRPTEEPRNDLKSRKTSARSSFSASPSSQRQGGALYTGQIGQITNNYYYVNPEKVEAGSGPPVYTRGGRPYTEQMAHIPHNHHFVTREQHGIGPVPLVNMGQSYVHWARDDPVLPPSFPPALTEYCMRRHLWQEGRLRGQHPLPTEDSHAQAAFSQAEARTQSQPQPQLQQHGPRATLVQQQAVGTSPRKASSFGTNPSNGTQRHVGVDIVPVGTPRSKTAPRKPSSSVGQPEPDLYEQAFVPIKRTRTVPIHCFPECSKSL